MKGALRLHVLVLAFAMLGVLGCAKKKAAADDTNPTPEVVDDTLGFNLRYVTGNGYTYEMHKSTAFDTACTAASGEEIDCLLEAEELDLFFNGATLQYNVPSTLCSYVTWTPYAY